MSVSYSDVLVIEKSVDEGEFFFCEGGEKLFEQQLVCYELSHIAESVGVDVGLVACTVSFALAVQTLDIRLLESSSTKIFPVVHQGNFGF